MSKEDVACYRLYAANCVEIANRISDSERRLFLLRMAQAWGNLAEHAEKAGAADPVRGHQYQRPEAKQAPGRTNPGRGG